MRINNFISATGYCSRRQADKLISEGRVFVNGQVAIIGQQVNDHDIVTVDGKQISAQGDHVYIVLNKPKGITSTTEQNIEGNIIDFINYPKRIFPIGRLDKDSHGLILLTSDGSIVNRLLDQSNNHEKDYLVTVNKPITNHFLKQMSEGVTIYNPVTNKYVKTKRCKVKKQSKHQFEITLTQGYNRQIRRMCSKLNYQVHDLQRIRFININLENLPIGKWRHLTPEELSELL